MTDRAPAIRGRPPHPPGTARRKKLYFRISDAEMERWLTGPAEALGLSVAGYVRYRLGIPQASEGRPRRKPAPAEPE